MISLKETAPDTKKHHFILAHGSRVAPAAVGFVSETACGTHTRHRSKPPLATSATAETS